MLTTVSVSVSHCLGCRAAGRSHERRGREYMAHAIMRPWLLYHQAVRRRQSATSILRDRRALTRGTRRLRPGGLKMAARAGMAAWGAAAVLRRPESLSGLTDRDRRFQVQRSPGWGAPRQADQAAPGLSRPRSDSRRRIASTRATLLEREGSRRAAAALVSQPQCGLQAAFRSQILLRLIAARRSPAVLQGLVALGSRVRRPESRRGRLKKNPP